MVLINPAARTSTVLRVVTRRFATAATSIIWPKGVYTILKLIMSMST